MKVNKLQRTTQRSHREGDACTQMKTLTRKPKLVAVGNHKCSRTSRFPGYSGQMKLICVKMMGEARIMNQSIKWQTWQGPVVMETPQPAFPGDVSDNV